MEKKRACILARVSTKNSTENDNQGSSLEYQVDKLTEVILADDSLIFDPEEDVYQDRHTGTSLVRKNTKTKGFDYLMSLLNISIIDINNEQEFQVSIKTKKGITPFYQVIYTKSTSRLARAFFKSSLLIEGLKQSGIEIRFYDINKSSFDDDLVVPIMGLIDSQYSKGISYNYRSNNIYKTKNKELTYKGDRIGYETKFIDGKKHYVINEQEYKLIRIAIDCILNRNMGCTNICKMFKENNMTLRDGRFLESSSLNKLLKNPLYIGKIKYYQYDDDYLKQYYDKKSYLKKLNYDYLECKYVEPIMTPDEQEQILKIFAKKSNQDRGFRAPYLPISNVLICGCCHSNFSSAGRYKGMRKFRCSKSIYDITACDNHRITESFLNEKIEQKMKNFGNNRNRFLKSQADNLLNLRLHLVSVIDNDSLDLMLDMNDKKEKLEAEIETLLSLDLSSESVKNTVLKTINEKDKQIKELELKISNLSQYQATVINFITQISETISKIDSEYNNQKSYDISVIDDFLLNEIEQILIFPIGEFVKGSKLSTDSVNLVFKYKYKTQINKILEEIYNNPMLEILVKKGVFSYNKSLNEYNIIPVENDKIDALLDRLRELDLF